MTNSTVIIFFHGRFFKVNIPATAPQPSQGHGRRAGRVSVAVIYIHSMIEMDLQANENKDD